MNPFGDSLLDEPLHWHRFDESMSDEQVKEAIASIGLEVRSIQREPGCIVFVVADRDRHAEIRDVLDKAAEQ